MHLYGLSVFEQQNETVRTMRGQTGKKLRAVAAVMLTLAAGVPSGFAQQTTPASLDKSAADLPSTPAPVLTEPYSLRPSLRDFSQPLRVPARQPDQKLPAHHHRQGQFYKYSVRLADLVKDGKIYLSLFRRHRLGHREQLRHRHCPLQPGPLPTPICSAPMPVPPCAASFPAS